MHIVQTRLLEDVGACDWKVPGVQTGVRDVHAMEPLVVLNVLAGQGWHTRSEVGVPSVASVKPGPQTRKSVHEPSFRLAEKVWEGHEEQVRSLVDVPAAVT